jgi:hypothetical protein
MADGTYAQCHAHRPEILLPGQFLEAKGVVRWIDRELLERTPGCLPIGMAEFVESTPDNLASRARSQLVHIEGPGSLGQRIADELAQHRPGSRFADCPFPCLIRLFRQEEAREIRHLRALRFGKLLADTDQFLGAHDGLLYIGPGAGCRRRSRRRFRGSVEAQEGITRPCSRLPSIRIRGHDERGMDVEGPCELLGALLADVDALVLERADVGGADAAAAGEFGLGRALELAKEADYLASGKASMRAAGRNSGDRLLMVDSQ